MTVLESKKSTDIRWNDKEGISSVKTRKKSFSVVRDDYTEKDRVERGTDLYYLCGKCGEAIPSIPKNNGGCQCGNVFIDKDYFRLVVEDYSNLMMVRKKD